MIASVGPARQGYDVNASRVEELILRNRIDTILYLFACWKVSIGSVHIRARWNTTFVHALRLCTGRTAHRGSRGIALLFHDQRQ